MTRLVQVVGMSPAEAAVYIGLPRQFIIEEDTWSLRILDGVTPGGNLLITQAVADGLYVSPAYVQSYVTSSISTALSTISALPAITVDGRAFVETDLAGMKSMLGLGSLAYLSSVPVAQGGTGASDAATARNNLGVTSIVASIDADIDTLAGAIAAKTTTAYVDTAVANEASARNSAISAAVAAVPQPGARNHDTNGYETLAGGLILQWGTYGGGSSNPTITFPTAFPSTCYNVQLTPVGTGTDTADTGTTKTVKIANIQTVSNTGFAAYLSGESGDPDVFKADTGLIFHWTAIGK